VCLSQRWAEHHLWNQGTPGASKNDSGAGYRPVHFLCTKEMSYPVYLLEMDGKIIVCHPPSKKDIDHSEFWEATVSSIVAEHYKIPKRLLANLPYCQRRARVVGKRVYYGERPSKKLLLLVQKALGNKDLVFVYDDHEKRLKYDVAVLKKLVTARSQ
jgi:hypothetical protein